MSYVARFSIFAALYFTFAFLFLNTAHATGLTFTVCSSGCDFTLLSDAITSPGLIDDTVTMTADYVFDPLLENNSFFIPEGVTIECAAGADTFGSDSETSRDFTFSNNSTLQNCTLENVDFGIYSVQNASLLNNVLTGTSFNQVIANNNETFEISDNEGLNLLVIGASDNGTVQNNTFECETSTCLQITGVGPITDFTDDAQISNDVDISNNEFSITDPANTGIMYSEGGENIIFSNNIISSAATLNDNFMSYIILKAISTTVEGNTFILPEKIGGATNGSWAISINGSDGDVNAAISHNTFLTGTDNTVATNSSCIGVFDDGLYAPATMNISFDYNLCYNNSSTLGGSAVNFSYQPAVGTTTINFSDSNNGIYNFQTLANDQSGVITSLDTSTITFDPVLQTQDADPTNDTIPAPMSNYYDVNGALDIGATSAVREDTYTIDDDCTVDYTTCASNNTSILDNVMRSDDTVTINDGTYGPIALPANLDGITLQGEGAGTIIDAVGVAQGLRLDSVTNSTISDFTIQNANTETFVYNMFSWALSAGGTDFDSLTPSALYIAADGACTSAFMSSPYSDVTNVAGFGTDNFGAFLIDISGAIQLVAYVPESVATSPAEVLTNCAATISPGTTIPYYATNVLSLQPDGTYVFNQSALSTAGITILGDGSDPYIEKVVSKAAGIYMSDSTDNEISNIIFSNNEVDIYFASGSSDNTASNVIFAGLSHDIVTDATADNYVNTSTISASSIEYNSTGDIIIDGDASNPDNNTGGSSGGSGSRSVKKVIPKVDPLVPTLAENNTPPSKEILISLLARFISQFPDLELGDERSEVLALQIFLNYSGYNIAASGPGSLGNETTYFGALTKAALARFQAANSISPALGYFGPKTKAYMGQL